MPQLSAMRMRDIKPVHIRIVMSNLSQYSRSVQSKALQTLRSIFDAAVENHIILHSPVSAALEPGGKTPKEKIPLTPEQSQRLLLATSGTRAHAAVALMLGAGLRKEERQCRRSIVLMMLSLRMLLAPRSNAKKRLETHDLQPLLFVCFISICGLWHQTGTKIVKSII